MFSDLAQIQLIRSICSLVSDYFALLRELVMMRVSGRSLLVSVGVLLCIFFFELQSESGAKMFHFSGYFFTFGFRFYETTYLKNALLYLFIHTA